MAQSSAAMELVPTREALEAARLGMRVTQTVDELLQHPQLRIVLLMWARKPPEHASKPPRINPRPPQPRPAVDIKKLQANDID